MLRLELHACRGAEAVRLLPARHQRLSEQAAERFAAEQSQIAGPLGKAEQLARATGERSHWKSIGRSRRIEIVARRRRGEGVRRQRRAPEPRARYALAVGRAKPAVRATRPSAGSPSPDRACSGRDWAAAGRTDSTRKVSPSGVSTKSAWPARCKAAVGPIAAVRCSAVGMHFVRPAQRARARHRHRMAPARAALGGEQIDTSRRACRCAALR